MIPPPELYQDLLSIVKSYMGLAADEYIERRCRVSLDITSPADLKIEDLDRLAAGIEMTAGAYMSEEKVRNFKNEVLKLAEKWRPRVS